MNAVLREKYSAYQHKHKYIIYYHMPLEINIRSLMHTNQISAELLDACFTGCELPYAKSTHFKFTEQTEEDIKRIVRDDPETIHCTIGTLEYREMVTPLVAACYNINVPVRVVEFLLQNGATRNLKVKVNSHIVDIRDDLEEDIFVPASRIKVLRELITAYENETLYMKKPTEQQ